MAALTPEQLIPRVEALRNAAVAARNELRAAYPRLAADDPRVVISRHIKAVISSSYLSLIHMHENLQDPNWWYRQGFGVAVASGSVPDELDDYMTLLTAGLVVYPFSLFEAGVRRVVRTIDSNACLGGASEFKGIYDWLFARLRQDAWIYPDGEAIEFLDLYRNVRNTIHNNGKYYSRTATDTGVTWKGSRYEFTHGTAPAFVDWDFNLTLLCELVRLNRSLMEAPTIEGLSPIP